MTSQVRKAPALTFAALAASLLHPASWAQTPMTRDEAVAFLAPSVPKTGSLEMVLVLKDTAMIPRVVGVDFATGACYQGQEGMVWGLEPGGASYHGQARPSGLSKTKDPNEAVTTDVITLSIPTVVAMDLVRKPELITRAERRADGGIDVWTDLSEGRRWPITAPDKAAPRAFTFKWEFDERARLKRYSSNMNNLAPEFEYLQGGPDGIDICSNAGFPHAYRLFSYDWKPQSDSARFRMAAVESLMVTIDMQGFDDPKRKGMSVAEAKAMAKKQASGSASAASTWLVAITGIVSACAVGWVYWKRRTN